MNLLFIFQMIFNDMIINNSKFIFYIIIINLHFQFFNQNQFIDKIKKI